MAFSCNRLFFCIVVKILCCFCCTFCAIYGLFCHRDMCYHGGTSALYPLCGRNMYKITVHGMAQNNKSKQFAVCTFIRASVNIKVRTQHSDNFTRHNFIFNKITSFFWLHKSMPLFSFISFVFVSVFFG